MSREAANAAFRAGSYAEAASLYTTCIKYTEKELETVADAARRSQLTEEQATLFTNRATARFHTNELDACIADCNSALELDHGRVKALFRRAQVCGWLLVADFLYV